jgi:DnaJ-class molecular chaperone
MINETTHKECTECLYGQMFEYEGAEPEPCPTCKGTGFIELTESEQAMERECKRVDVGLTKWL